VTSPLLSEKDRAFARLASDRTDLPVYEGKGAT
jgi:hypothetical protein